MSLIIKYDPISHQMGADEPDGAVRDLKSDREKRPGEIIIPVPDRGKY